MLYCEPVQQLCIFYYSVLHTLFYENVLYFSFKVNDL